MLKLFLELKHLAAVEDLAKQFSTALLRLFDSRNNATRLVVYLNGHLGVGKTTFVRAVLRHLGYQDRVKSPTYTIVESYVLAFFDLHHFDLYRLVDAEELLYLGCEDYFTDNSVIFIEWAENGGHELPQPDLIFSYDYSDAVAEMRTLTISAETPQASTMLNHFE